MLIDEGWVGGSYERRAFVGGKMDLLHPIVYVWSAVFTGLPERNQA